MNGKKANTINRYKYFHHVNHQKIQQSSKKTLWASLIITLLFTVIEFVGGLVSNSLALLSDSFHMLSDVLALGLSMLAIYFTGWRIIDPIISIVISLIILRGGYKITRNAWLILMESVPQHL
ncbi:cation transporter, partial [Staphylococcus aureus]|nr:cation transporter [Staphylococcus aureus]